MPEQPRLYPPIFDSIDLGRSHGDSCACLGTSPDAQGWLDLAFGKDETRPIILETGENWSRRSPAGFDALITQDRLAFALNWILNLDNTAKRKYLNDHVVTIRVPTETPKPLPSVRGMVGAEDYWKLRQSGGALIRPLLLENPSMEELFPYQRQGVAWLLQSKSVILADDMGLGKTVQAITALRFLFRRGLARSALILCPKSLLANWEKELEKWAPELSRVRVVARASQRDQVWSSVFNRVHVLLTNYEQARTPPKALLTSEIEVIIADEAHRIRNLSSQITRGVRRFSRNRFWALTGTPIERDTKDLATILSTIEPRRFAPTDGKLEHTTLRARARAYILRRHKETVLRELPKVLESTEVIELLPAQRKSYRRAIQKTSKLLNKDLNLLALINKLRTICDYDPVSEKSAKVNRIEELVEDIASTGEKTVVFSYLLKPLYMLHERLQRLLINTSAVLVEGSMSLEERHQALTLFKTQASTVALLASSRVVGEGLTLTEANHVIFLNEWWNPSANAQARDRVVRIGQRKGVRVYRLICKDTIEESLQKILAEKGETFKIVIDRLAETKSEDSEVVKVLRILESDIRREVYRQG